MCVLFSLSGNFRSLGLGHNLYRDNDDDHETRYMWMDEKLSKDGTLKLPHLT